MKFGFDILFAIAALTTVTACNIKACKDRPLLECDLILCSPTIDLANRHLTGTIPAEIGSLFVTNHLDLSSNQLSGTIPGLLGNLILSELNLSNNTLTGTIPAKLASIYNPSTLFYLFTERNKLTGAIPSKYCEKNEPMHCTLETKGGTNHLCIPGDDCSVKSWCGVDTQCKPGPSPGPSPPHPSPGPSPKSFCCEAKKDDPAYKPVCEKQQTEAKCESLSATCDWTHCAGTGKCNAKPADKPYQPFCATKLNRTACLAVNATCEWDK